MLEREISPSGSEFYHGLGKPLPWLNSDPSGEIPLSYMYAHGGLFYYPIIAHVR